MAKRKASVLIKECVACGTCVKVCQVGAISVNKGLYADVSAKCVGCGRCSASCPASVIEMQEVTP